MRRVRDIFRKKGRIKALEQNRKGPELLSILTGLGPGRSCSGGTDAEGGPGAQSPQVRRGCPLARLRQEVVAPTPQPAARVPTVLFLVAIDSALF